MEIVCSGCGLWCDCDTAYEIAEASFCASCVERLRGAVALDAGGAQQALAVRLPAESPCFLCGGPLAPGADRRLRGFDICGECAAAIDAGSATAEEAACDDEIATARARRDAPSTPGAGTVWCAGCGRPMPGVGSYRLVAGRPYCPGCAPLDTAAALVLCAACLGPATESRTKHGFRICAACLDSDAALALAIARARHRHTLARIGRGLLRGGDDE